VVVAVAAGSDPEAVRARRLLRLPRALHLLPALHLLLPRQLADVPAVLRPAEALHRVVAI
jgi:hypothetical protein